MVDRTLTEQEKKFIDALLGEADGDLDKAKDIAGYSNNTRTRQVVKSLRKEIIEAAEIVLASYAIKAAKTLGESLSKENPSAAKDRAAVAEKVLDRVGIVKKEQIDVNLSEGSIFILPPKVPVRLENAE
jgi:hypothetical protein